MSIDPELLQAALVGLEHRRSEIEERMADLRRRFGARGVTRPGASSIAESASRPGRKRRRMSATGRRRIAEAQRRRWAEARKEKEAPPETPTESPRRKKRRISAAGRKRIIAATKKRWAEFRAKKAAAARWATAAKKAASVKLA